MTPLRTRGGRKESRDSTPAGEPPAPHARGQKTVKPVLGEHLLLRVSQDLAALPVDEADPLLRVDRHHHDPGDIEVLLGLVPLLPQKLLCPLVQGDVRQDGLDPDDLISVSYRIIPVFDGEDSFWGDNIHLSLHRPAGQQNLKVGEGSGPVILDNEVEQALADEFFSFEAILLDQPVHAGDVALAVRQNEGFPRILKQGAVLLFTGADPLLGFFMPRDVGHGRARMTGAAVGSLRRDFFLRLGAQGPDFVCLCLPLLHCAILHPPVPVS